MRQSLGMPPANAGLTLPLMGRIAAGRPVEAMENPESISLADFTRSKDVYVLQVTGESMQDEHIVNGDYVLVEKTNIARDGEIVVALVGGSDATLKRIFTRRRQDPAATVECRDAAHRGASGRRADPGAGHRSAAEVLKTGFGD